MSEYVEIFKTLAILSCGRFYISPLLSKRLCLPHVNQTPHVRDFSSVDVWIQCYASCPMSTNQLCKSCQSCDCNFSFYTSIKASHQKILSKKVTYGTDLIFTLHDLTLYNGLNAAKYNVSIHQNGLGV